MNSRRTRVLTIATLAVGLALAAGMAGYLWLGGGMALGRPCDVDGDCDGDALVCGPEEAWPIAGQCTMECEIQLDCEDLFGRDGTCIGAGYCVSECGMDSDCPEGARCNEHGWCRQALPPE